MLYSLAIVLALAMVLCMIPAAFADTLTKTVADKPYNIEVFSWNSDKLGGMLGHTSGKANSVTAKYNYEEEVADVTGMFTEDGKMAVVKFYGLDPDFEKADQSTIEVTVDGKPLDVNMLAGYSKDIGYQVGTQGYVMFPIELTKGGFTDTFIIQITGDVKKDDDTIKLTETAKISVTFQNTAAYKNSKTAYIQKIESTSKDLNAYIVGDKIYLDFVAENLANWDKPDGSDYSEYTNERVKIYFQDNNHRAFSDVTWAYCVKGVDSVKNHKNTEYFKPHPLQTATDDNGTTVYGAKLDDDSAMTYTMYDITDEATVVFKLETGSDIYETKEFDIVYRDGVEEKDPQGIYFKETEKTIAIGESYTPVLMGVATGSPVKGATILPGQNTDKQVIDIDDDTIIGTQEGVAYITAEYSPALLDNYQGAAGTVYKSNSMKIVVTATKVDDDTTTDGASYIVTASSLRVRSGAGTNFSQIGSLKNGATVKVESIANGWAKLENGGYVSAQYLAKVVENGEAQTMYVTARTLNVRKGPGTSYAKAGTLSRGTAVQVVGFSGNWAKLSNGYYVSTSYLAK